MVIAPMLQVRKNGTPVSFGGESYGPYDYVPTEYLNTLSANKTDAEWTNLYTGDKLANGNVNPDDPEERGVHIRNDFITVGTEHTGGLYGGGNLSMVDGYRELNITNYGTDYYGMDDQISLEKYQTLTNRERAYFKLEYQFQKDELEIAGTTYHKNDRISEDD